MARKSGGSQKHPILVVIIILVIIGIIAGLGFFLYHSGIFQPPVGQIIYSDDLDPSARSLIERALSEQELNLQHDLNITSVRHTSTTPEDLVYNIYLPITDFYDSNSDIDAQEAKQGTLIPFSELNNQVKLLALDGEYYLDTLNTGAFFDIITLTGEPQDVTKVTDLIRPALPVFPTKDTILTFAQTGVTALSRGMNAKLNAVQNPHHFAAHIAEYLSSFDLTHTSNEASFSSSAPSNNGTTVICALPDMLTTLTDIGLDIVELTGNHNQDCGNQAALNTLQTYQGLNIKTFGGGENATSAAVPLQINQKATNITMLGYNLSTGGYTLGETPGANFFTLEKATEDISTAKARGDFVVVDVQYYECNDYDHVTEHTACDYANSSAGDQIGLFRQIIDLGADLVVGTAAHQPQTYELYHNGAIYYGLGNLFFDQSWWPGTTRSLILAHYFYQGRLLQTRLVPTIYDSDLQTRLMDLDAATAFIDRLNQARPESEAEEN